MDVTLVYVDSSGTSSCLHAGHCVFVPQLFPPRRRFIIHQELPNAGLGNRISALVSVRYQYPTPKHAEGTREGTNAPSQTRVRLYMFMPTQHDTRVWRTRRTTSIWICMNICISTRRAYVPVFGLCMKPTACLLCMDVERRKISMLAYISIMPALKLCRAVPPPLCVYSLGIHTVHALSFRGFLVPLQEQELFDMLCRS